MLGLYRSIPSVNKLCDLLDDYDCENMDLFPCGNFLLLFFFRNGIFLQFVCRNQQQLLFFVIYFLMSFLGLEPSDDEDSDNEMERESSALKRQMFDSAENTAPEVYLLKKRLRSLRLSCCLIFIYLLSSRYLVQYLMNFLKIMEHKGIGFRKWFVSSFFGHKLSYYLNSLFAKVAYLAQRSVSSVIFFRLDRSLLTREAQINAFVMMAAKQYPNSVGLVLSHRGSRTCVFPRDRNRRYTNHFINLSCQLVHILLQFHYYTFVILLD